MFRSYWQILKQKIYNSIKVKNNSIRKQRLIFTVEKLENYNNSKKIYIKTFKLKNQEWRIWDKD